MPGAPTRRNLLRQNGRVTQWAGIESGAASERASATAAANPAAAAPAPDAAERMRRRALRLRRTDRLVLGSIDGGAHVFQRRARALLLGSAVFLLPMTGLQVLVTSMTWSRFDTFDGLLGDRGYLGAERGATALAFIVHSLFAHLVGAYVAAYMVPYQMGGEPRVAVVVRRVVRRLPILLFTWAVTHCWLAVGALIYLSANADEAAGWAIFLGPLAAFLSALALFVAPVVMVEGPREAMSRAVRLTRGRMGAVFGFVCMNMLIGSVLSLSIAFLPMLADSTGLITLGGYGWLFEGVFAQLAVLIVMPFSAAVTAQMYLQTRVHAEGLDIVLAADAAFAGRR